jgi:hypothetical protein
MTKSTGLLRFVVPILCAAACANDAARPTTPTTPTTPTAPTAPVTPIAQAGGCDASGDVLFEDDVDISGVRSNKSSWKIIYASGAWRSADTQGKNLTGCLTAGELSTVQHDVDAPWAASPRTGIRCHTERRDPIVYSARGKEVYVDGGCSSDVLDDVSAKALAQIEKIFSDAIARPAAPPQPAGASPTPLHWQHILDQQPCPSPPPPATCAGTQIEGAACTAAGEMCSLGCNAHLLCRD